VSTPTEKVALKLLSTGVPGLDEVLGGGLPEYSFNLVAGTPGAGKTTLIHQLAFANATPEAPAVYFTVVGEPPLKMLRYQQQMDFFDGSKVSDAIRFIDLSQEVLQGDLELVLQKLIEHVTELNPSIVIVDSFRTVLRGLAGKREAELELQGFLQRLALHLTSWQVTSFLIGEYGESEVHDNPVFTVADGILWLSQHRERNSIVRKLEVVKMRGRPAVPGLHTFRISSAGVQVFPRTASRIATHERSLGTERAGFGIAALDQMLGGGLPAGDATLIAGPSGSGKTLLGTHFVAEGYARGESSVLAVFEEYPEDYIARAQQLGFDLGKMVDEGRLEVLALRPLDLSADEILLRVQEAVTRLDAKRLVIDSVNGLELSLAPTFREEFSDSLFRLVGRLTGGGVSVVLTIEVMESFSELKFSPHAISFLSQNIIFLRYVEIDAQLRSVVAVVKMRRSAHSRELHEYTIGANGVEMRSVLRNFVGVLTGVPRQLDVVTGVEAVRAEDD
jgi:circadian clock protein KaiC